MPVVLDPPLGSSDPDPRVDPPPPTGTANTGGATVEAGGTSAAFTILNPADKTEQLVLGDLFLNGGSTYTLEELSCPPPKKRAEWISGGDSDGSALVRDPLYDNREITVKLRISAASMDAALKAIADVNARLELAEINPVELLWMPAGASNYLTFYVLSGEITDLPISIDSGWFVGSPTVSLTMTCKPFGYGPWRNEWVSGNGPSFPPKVFVISDIEGDVPAEGKLSITDTSSNAWRHVEWGIELYDPANPNPRPALLIDSDNLSGAPGNNVAAGGGMYDPDATLPRYMVGGGAGRITAETQLLALSGTYRVRARITATSDKVSYPYAAVRSANGPTVKSAPTYTHLAGNWIDVDLGLVSVPDNWGGAYVSVWDCDFLDYIVLVPVDGGYGKAAAEYTSSSSALVKSEDWASPVVIGDPLDLTANWDIAGNGPDFTVGTWPGSTIRDITITTTGSGPFTRFGLRTDVNQPLNSTVEADVMSIAGGGSIGVLSRYKDAVNYVRATMDAQLKRLYLDVVIGGSTQRWSNAYVSTIAANRPFHIRLTTYQSGRAVAQLIDSTSGKVVGDVSIISDDLKPTGVLGTGPTLRGGVYHTIAGAGTSALSGWSMSTPTPESVVIGPSETSVISHESALRQVSATEQLPLDSYRGARLFLPALKSLNRRARMLVKAKLDNVETYTDDVTTIPNVSMSLDYRARYVVVPYE